MGGGGLCRWLRVEVSGFGVEDCEGGIVGRKKYWEGENGDGGIEGGALHTESGLLVFAAGTLNWLSYQPCAFVCCSVQFDVQDSFADVSFCRDSMFSSITYPRPV